MSPASQLLGANVGLTHNIDNPYDFTWNYDDRDSVKFRVNLDRIIEDTIRQVIEMEEQARLKVVVQYLRSIGYFIREPDGTYK